MLLYRDKLEPSINTLIIFILISRQIILFKVFFFSSHLLWFRELSLTTLSNTLYLNSRKHLELHTAMKENSSNGTK